jgi:glycosyltransferase involved in cell wall biosynthesis
VRIAQITKDWRPNGGVAVYVRDLARALARAGHEVVVVHADPGAPAVGGGVREVAVQGFAEWGEGAARTTEEVLAALAAFAPEVVHVHACNNFALERALRARYPALKTLHTLDFCPAGGRYHYTTHRLCTHRVGRMCLPRMAYKRCTLSKRPWVWWHLLRRAFASRADCPGYRAIVVTSHYVRRFVVDEGLADAQVHVVPYFTEIPDVPAPMPEPPRLLFAGRVYPEKGLDLLLKAVARLRRREVGVDVVGDGPGLPLAKALARRLGILPLVSFHGWQRDVGVFYRRASVVVVPSRLAEPFGIVGIEAMSHARPTVAFAVGGIPDWLEDGVTGFLVTPYDVDQMAARLAALIHTPDLARRLGEAGRRRVQQRFTADVHLAQLIEVYRRVANV